MFKWKRCTRFNGFYVILNYFENCMLVIIMHLYIGDDFLQQISTHPSIYQEVNYFMRVHLVLLDRIPTNPLIYMVRKLSSTICIWDCFVLKYCDVITSFFLFSNEMKANNLNYSFMRFSESNRISISISLMICSLDDIIHYSWDFIVFQN